MGAGEVEAGFDAGDEGGGGGFAGELAFEFGGGEEVLFEEASGVGGEGFFAVVSFAGFLELGFEVEDFEGEFGEAEGIEFLAGADDFVFLAGEFLLDLGGVEAGDEVALLDGGVFGDEVFEGGGALEADGDAGYFSGFEVSSEEEGLGYGAGGGGEPLAGGGGGGAGAAGGESEEGEESDK